MKRLGWKLNDDGHYYGQNWLSGEGSDEPLLDLSARTVSGAVRIRRATAAAAGQI